MTTEAPPVQQETPPVLFDPVIGTEQQEAPQEAPRRRRRRTAAEIQAEEGARSSEGKRKYTRRTTDPCRIVEQQEEQLKDSLAAMFVMTGGSLAMAVAVTGTTLAMRAEQEAQALIDVARVNPAFARVLLKIAEGSAYSGLVMCVAALGTAVMVDMRAIPPTAPPAQFLIGDVLQRFVVEEPAHSQNGTASNPAEYASAF